MNDRELLELAAIAAGIQVLWRKESLYRAHGGVRQHPWNPMENDGDAFRLANKLHLSCCHTLGGVQGAHGTAMVCIDPWKNQAPIAAERYASPKDADSAMRRAIVRAAAEIEIQRKENHQ